MSPRDGVSTETIVATTTIMIKSNDSTDNNIDMSAANETMVNLIILANRITIINK